MTTEKDDLYTTFNLACPASLPKNSDAAAQKETRLPAGQVEMLIAATLAFRRAGVTPESNVALDRLVDAVPGAKTVVRGYGGRSRTVQLPDSQVDLLKATVGPDYTVEPNASVHPCCQRVPWPSSPMNEPNAFWYFPFSPCARNCTIDQPWS